MLIYDISGIIQDKMWNYGTPFPEFHIQSIGNVAWTANKVYCEEFDGMHSQTGTYLETPAHFYGYENSYLINDVPLEKLVNIDCNIIMLDENDYSINCDKKVITTNSLIKCMTNHTIKEGNAIIVGTGWGKYWMNKDYLYRSPYFSIDAIEWLISKKPIIMGTDFPRWENIDNPEGLFPLFYKNNILMLAPCINIENVIGNLLKLTVLPLRIQGTCCTPCRAILIDDGCGKYD